MIRKPLEAGMFTLTSISSVLLLVCTVLSAGNAISRFAFSVSSPFIEEFSCIMAVIIMYLMQPRLEYKDEQLSIAILDEKLKNFPAARRVIFYIRGLVTLFIYVLLIKAGFDVVRVNMGTQSSTPIMHLPYAVLYGIVTALLIVVVFYWIFHFFLKRDFREGAEK